MTNDKRADFEAAVIERFKESGYLEVEIRVECLGRSGDGYQDGSVDAYWHFWQKAQAAVVAMPSFEGYQDHIVRELQAAFSQAVEAAGLKVES